MTCSISIKQEARRLFAKHKEASEWFEQCVPGSPAAIEAAWQSHDTRIEFQRYVTAHAEEILS